MNLCAIASGSSGNCIYVGSEKTHLLVDVGISKKRVEEGLESLELKASELDGILITHEHSDHISGLGVFSRKYGVPIYGTKGTLDAIKNYKGLGKVDESLFHVISPDSDFQIDDITVEATTTWHDAADPVCYSFSNESGKVVVATDMGNYDEYLLRKLRNANVLFIEANHDIQMLQVGPYPYYLKQRILGNYGHLSNERAGQLIRALLHEKVKAIVLGHLSKENNLAELAYETVNLELLGNEYSNDIRDFNLQVANRDIVSQLVATK